MLKDFYNRIYDDNIDIQEIINAIQPEIDALSESVENSFRDAFPIIATERGVLQWENALSIISDPLTETLDFRRGRIINRLISDIPYTETALKNIMNNIMGFGGWSYELNYRAYTLNIASLRHGKNWVNEVKITLDKIIPANLVYTLTIRYNQHQALSDYTHGFLGQFTHLEIREEDLG